MGSSWRLPKLERRPLTIQPRPQRRVEETQTSSMQVAGRKRSAEAHWGAEGLGRHARALSGARRGPNWRPLIMGGLLASLRGPVHPPAQQTKASASKLRAQTQSDTCHSLEGDWLRSASEEQVAQLVPPPPCGRSGSQVLLLWRWVHYWFIWRVNLSLGRQSGVRLPVGQALRPMEGQWKWTGQERREPSWETNWVWGLKWRSKSITRRRSYLRKSNSGFEFEFESKSYCRANEERQAGSTTALGLPLGWPTCNRELLIYCQ